MLNIPIEKGKKFGLNVVDSDNHVYVTHIDEGSMCTSYLRKFDRICDVDGTRVTDKELTKRQIIKGLKENHRATIVVERPANEERTAQVKRMLESIENKPPSVVLEADVKDILNRYSSKLKTNSSLKPRCALSKSNRTKVRHKVHLNDKQMETVNIGMDNEHLQEDLIKVPEKTYETSLANLQKQPQGAD
ncbi:PDZ/DHR/GLGF domain protein [Cooperia oncophora]